MAHKKNDYNQLYNLLKHMTMTYYCEMLRLHNFNILFGDRLSVLYTDFSFVFKLCIYTY